MPTPFDGLQPMSFAGTKFPYKTYRVQGGIRKHEFNYPHNAGGVTEKLGRKLYVVHVSANFTAGLLRSYPTLWEDLKTLRRHFANQDTETFNIPHIGEMSMFADDWAESVNGKDRSTIDVEMTFTEELPDDFTINKVATTNSGEAMSDALTRFQDQSFAVNAELSPNTQNIFSAINDICSSILGIKDQLDLYGSLIVSKIEGATQIIRDADQQVQELNNPDFWPLLDALQDLWLANVQLQQDIQQSGVQLKVFTTPLRMTVAQVSSAIFGDNSHAVDIMTLNPIDDPFSIPAGFQLQYYASL